MRDQASMAQNLRFENSNPNLSTREYETPKPSRHSESVFDFVKRHGVSTEADIIVALEEPTRSSNSIKSEIIRDSNSKKLRRVMTEEKRPVWAYYTDDEQLSSSKHEVYVPLSERNEIIIESVKKAIREVSRLYPDGRITLSRTAAQMGSTENEINIPFMRAVKDLELKRYDDFDFLTNSRDVYYFDYGV